MGGGHVVHLVALNAGAVPVLVVDLQLYGLDLGVLGEDAVEQLGTVVIGDAKVPRAPIGHKLLGGLKDALAGVHLVVGRVHRVGQQQVKVLNAAGVELILEHAADGRWVPERAVRELVHQEEAVTRVALDEALAQRHLALAAQVDVRGVKVVESRLEEAVKHLVAKLKVGLTALHGKSHCPKAKASLELVCIQHVVPLPSVF